MLPPSPPTPKRRNAKKFKKYSPDQPRDDNGRWSGGGGGAGAADAGGGAGGAGAANAGGAGGAGAFGGGAHNLGNALREGKGFTVDKEGKSPTSGYMVSPNKGSEVSLPSNQWTDAKITEFVAQHASELAQSNYYLGGWSYEGKGFLDVSFNTQSLNEAMSIGRSNDQIAVWDIGKGNATGDGTMMVSDYWQAQGGGG